MLATGLRNPEKASSRQAILEILRHRKFSNNAVPDLNENICGSTDLAKDWHTPADLYTPIHPTLLGSILPLHMLSRTTFTF